MDYIELLGFVAAGIIGGFISGILGVGGGIVFVPVVQHVLFNHQIKEDVVSYTLANSLALVLIVGISGTILQLKLKNTHIPSALVTGISAILTSLSLTYIISYYEWNNLNLFNMIFAVILIFTALRMLISTKTSLSESVELKMPSLKKFIPAGLFAGVITAISGLGGGIVMVPYFNKVLKLPIRFSTGLSLSVIPIIALPLLIFYAISQPAELVSQKYQTGFLLWPVILPIACFAVIASQFGIRFSQKLNPRVIQLIFVLFVLLTLGKMFLFNNHSG